MHLLLEKSDWPYKAGNDHSQYIDDFPNIIYLSNLALSHSNVLIPPPPSLVDS